MKQSQSYAGESRRQHGSSPNLRQSPLHTSSQKSEKLVIGLHRPVLWSLAALFAPLAAQSALGADAVITTNSTAAVVSKPSKPAWLSELSFGVKESYDNNIYLSGAEPSAASTAAGLKSVKERASFITTVSPKAAFNFIPLLGDQKTFDVLSFSYAPDFVTYHSGDAPNAVAGRNTPDESYTNHRLVNSIKGKTGDFSYGLDNAFNYIDGAEEGLIYPDSRLSAYGTGTIRERREQIQDRSKVTLRYDQDKWFVRPNASLLYYDLLSRKDGVTAGYQNYADRYDANGGVDFGLKLDPKVTPTLGYKYGHQYQEQYSFGNPAFSSSDYHRVLAGVEAKPLKWLKLELQAGPDFRSYVAQAPVNDRNPVKYYGEASVIADLTPKDTITFKYKQFQWVSSTGRIPYFDSLYDLGYKHKLTDKLQLDLGFRTVASDYTSSNLNGTRNDYQYTVSTGLRYAFNSNVSADLGYAVDLGRNAQDNITNPEFREFNHHLVSLGLQLKF